MLCYFYTNIVEKEQYQLKVKKKIVISGGPGSGKTTLINLLIKRGFHCFDEISRSFIEEGKKQGIHNVFKSTPLDFSRFLWEGRKADYMAANQIEFGSNDLPWVFYDRGLPDVTAYLNQQGVKTKEWGNELKQHKYDLVFLIAPEESIYTTDGERMENFEQAKALHQSLKKTYLGLGKIIEVPFLTPNQRLNFILTHCHD